MKNNGREHRRNPKPVTHIELSEKNLVLRIILFAGFLILGLGCIGAGIMSALSADPGWQEIEATASGPSCAGEFKLMYDFSESGNAATDQKKKLTNLYTQALEDAFRIFTPDVQEEGLRNVAYLNANPNEAVEVEPALYKALAQVAEYGNRHVFLAPATVEYNRVFSCENDLEAALYVPENDPQTVQWLTTLCRYIQDPEMIRLEILGDNRVRLCVSQEYLSFAQENELGKLLDFGFMANAFIADYLADVLTEAGYRNGYLYSFDGFTRNLDTRSQSYQLNLFDRKDSGSFLPARLRYTAPASIVSLRDYPTVAGDRWHYYAFESGEIVTVFLDPMDGLSKSALHNLVSYSADLGCGEILLRIVDVFIAEEFHADALNDLTSDGVYSIWYEGNVLNYNDAANPPELLTREGENQYRISLVK